MDNTKVAPHPKVSIAVAAYNTQDVIGECLDSLLEQSFCDFEVLICDDCSTDSTYAIAQSYAQKDARVRVFRNAENAGQAYGRNKLFKEARAPYVTIIDSDDKAVPERLCVQVEFLEKTHNMVFVPRGAKSWMTMA